MTLPLISCSNSNSYDTPSFTEIRPNTETHQCSTVTHAISVNGRTDGRMDDLKPELPVGLCIVNKHVDHSQRST